MIAEALQLGAALNLACTGVQIDMRVDHGRMHDRRQTAFSTVFRVDPVGKRWCADACAEVRTLSEVTEKSLIFEYVWDRDVQLISSVSLEDGGLLLNDRDKSHWTIRRGICHPLAFSGFPEAAAAR